MGYVDLDTIGRPAVNGTLLTTWGDQVDDNFKAIRLSPFIASAYRNAVQSIAHATVTTVAFNATVFDPNGNVNVGTGAYTAPATGYYTVASTIVWTCTVTTGTSFVTVLKNGAEVKRGNQIALFAGNPSVTTGGILLCTAGDTLSVQAYQSSGGAINAIAGQQFTFFDIAYLHS